MSSYLLLSLPESSYRSAAALGEFLTTIAADVPRAVTPFPLPDFKIGTLDSLVTQTEDLAKLDSSLQQAFGKVVEIQTALLDAPKTPTPNPRQFRWNASSYRLDKPVPELVAMIRGDAMAVETDLRTANAAYQQSRNLLASATRKRTGDLTVKSLHEVVKADDFVSSDYLVTVLVVVPKAQAAAFTAAYETLATYVVPRSAKELAVDSEYVLYAVTVFKKYSAEFLARCRERKWHPRDFIYLEVAVNELREEYNTAGETEKRMRRELGVLAATAHAEVHAAMLHVKTLRVYCESVLRYGLPALFYVFLVEVWPKEVDKARAVLEREFGYLGGKAFDRDSKGRIERGGLVEYAGIVDIDYEPFVMYTL